MHDIRKIFSSFQLCTRGNIGMIFALSAVPFLGAGGVGIDYSRAAIAKTILQAATDAAALAAANSSVESADKGAVAKAIFSANVQTSSLVKTASAFVKTSNDSVSVTSAVQVPTTIMRVFGQQHMDVVATSQAVVAKSYGNAAPACVLALSKVADGAFYVNGTTNFEAVNCGVYTNSAANESMRAVGAPDVSASNFCTVGGADINGNFLPLPVTGCSAVPDPFADLAAPSSDECTGRITITTLKKGEHTLTPGTYCGGLELMAGASVKFEPGIYVIKGGPLIFRSQSVSSGTNIGFYLTGTDAQMKINGGAFVDFHAAAKGELAGLVAAQDKTANAGATSIIQGGGTVKLVGALYFPTQTLEISGNGDLGQETSAWALVADQVHLKGNGSVRIEALFTAEGLPDHTDLSNGTGPRLMN